MDDKKRWRDNVREHCALRKTWLFILKKQLKTDFYNNRNNTFPYIFLFGLVWFYGTSIIVGYLMPNPFLYI